MQVNRLPAAETENLRTQSRVAPNIWRKIRGKGEEKYWSVHFTSLFKKMKQKLDRVFKIVLKKSQKNLSLRVNTLTQLYFGNFLTTCLEPKARRVLQLR